VARAGLVLLLAASVAAHAEECFKYEPEVVHLHGLLRLQVFPGPPHYRAIETGDAPETVWMITLDAPACIDAVPDDAWDTAQSNVRVVQIVPRGSFNLSMNGKPAVVEGTLYRAHGGHPHAEILLRGTKVATP
jgi:hypothetical protein